MHNCSAKKMASMQWPKSLSERTFTVEDELCWLRTPAGYLSRKNQAEAAGLAEAELAGPEVVEQAAVAEPEAREEPAELVALVEQGEKVAPEVREAPEELAEEPPGVPAVEPQ
jgi:hypothetical protein